MDLFTSVSPPCSFLKRKKKPCTHNNITSTPFKVKLKSPRLCRFYCKYCPLKLQPGRQRCCPFRVGQCGEKLTASLHECLRKVRETTLLFQSVPTAGVLPRTLQVDYCFYAFTLKKKHNRLQGPEVSKTLSIALKLLFDLSCG